MPGGATMRIGELARRTGVSPELLRAWERRYGLLRPARTQGGFRLYSAADEQRIVTMRGLLDEGLSAAEAARVALASVEREPVARMPEAEAGELLDALLAYDDVRAQAAFDRLLADFGLETVLRDAVLPILGALGERWEAGTVTVAQEHFASNLLRGRILGLARGWDKGLGPRAVLAAPPGEHHDLSMAVFGLALRQHGWRITFLGTDTPIATLVAAAAQLEPRVVVVVAAVPERLADVVDELAAAARDHALAIAGRGATPELAVRIGALLLREDPFAAAERVAGLALHAGTGFE